MDQTSPEENDLVPMETDMDANPEADRARHRENARD